MNTPSPPLHRWSRWLELWTMLGLPGLGLALLTWGLWTVVGVALVVAVPAVLVFVLLRLDRDRAQDSATPGMPYAGLVARVVACVAVTTLSLLAIASWAPSLVMLILPTQIVSTPPVLDRWRRRSAARPHPGTPASVRDEGTDPLAWSSPAEPEVLRTMSDHQLCRAWRSSYWVLRDTGGTTEGLAAVALRERLLVELDRRNPRALAAWLCSGPRASGGPERFLDGGPEGATGGALPDDQSWPEHPELQGGA